MIEQQHPISRRRTPNQTSWRNPVLVLSLLLGWLLSSDRGAAAEAVTEHQVKAVCLLNFAKYVTWPEGTFSDSTSPIRIGVLGHENVEDELKTAAAGRLIAGRPVVVVNAKTEAEWSACSIVFIGGGERGRVSEVLGSLRKRAIVTVGESDRFMEAGGMINFLKKDHRVRFEVHLGAARSAGLQISSKLLSLADTVHGKEP